MPMVQVFCLFIKFKTLFQNNDAACLEVAFDGS